MENDAVIFHLVHFIFFNILSGVSPGDSIKSVPDSIFSAAVNVTASDLVVGEGTVCQTFLWVIQFFILGLPEGADK